MTLVTLRHTEPVPELVIQSRLAPFTVCLEKAVISANHCILVLSSQILAISKRPLVSYRIYLKISWLTTARYRGCDQNRLDA